MVSMREAQSVWCSLMVMMPVSLSCTLLPWNSCMARAIAAYTSLLTFPIMICFISLLHRNVTVLLSRQSLTLGGQLCQCTTDAEAGVARLNHVVDVAILGCLVRISEEI